MSKSKQSPDDTPVTWADIKSRKKPVRDELKLCLDRQLIVEKKASEAAWVQAERRHNVLLGIDDLPPEMVRKAQEELVEAEALKDSTAAAADGDSITFEFQAMGGTALDELMKAHRPTKEQQLDYQEEQKRKGMPGRDFLDYNPDTFPPFLIAASLISPVMTPEDATEMVKDPNWSQGELTAILTAAWNVNQILAQ